MNSKYIKEYFRFESDPIANPESIVQGNKFRFTILTNRLIRMEYSEKGIFEDRPSQTFWFRNQPKPEFKVSDEGKRLIIETEFLKLKYLKDRHFTPFSLSIQIKKMNKTWFYGRPDFKNLRGTARTLDAAAGPIPLGKGLMSKNGFSVVNDSNSLVFDENYWVTKREQNNKDLYFFGYEKEFLKCLSDFYAVSGKTPLIPRYILGNWWSRYWEYTEPELKELISNFEKHKIPLSVCIIDMDWHLVKIDKKYGRGWTGFTWNKEFFPDPQRMLKWLHDQNLNIALNLHPALGIRAHEDCYEDVADFMGVEKADEEPVKFDITDPKFVTSYFDLVLHPLEEMGVDFWWVDWQQGRKSAIEGLDPLWMLNHLHFYDLGRDGEKRPFIFSRWGKRGNHRYPIGFSGDTLATWGSLKFQPYFTATASNVGFGWWSHDIGGHMLGKDDSELYTRWVQLGVFSPIIRLHSTKNEFLKREPWKYDLDTLEHVGDIMKFRHRLIPYLYSMAYRNYEQNIPLILPLYYTEPNSPQSYKFKSEYWFGSEMIVAPVVKRINEKTNRALQKTYLPKVHGSWFNLFTKEYHKGGNAISRVYKISDVPVFVKSGGIIPLVDDIISNGTANPENLVLEIFPGESNKFELYEDDGKTVKYKSGDHFITKFSLQWEEKVTFSIDKPKKSNFYIPKVRKYLLNFNAIKNPKNISVSSQDHIEFEINYLNQQNILVIRILSDEFSQLEISFDKPDIIKESKIEEELHRMLLDSKIHIMKKRLLQKIYFAEKKFTSKTLKHLYRAISRSF